MKQQLQEASEATSSAALDRPPVPRATQQSQANGDIGLKTFAIGILGVIVAILAVGGAIAALVGKMEERLNAKVDGLASKVDGLAADVNDIRVYIASVHGDRITFKPIKAAQSPTWVLQAVDPETRAVQDIGKLTVKPGAERRAVLELGDGGPAREWTHFDLEDTFRRATRLMALAAAE